MTTPPLVEYRIIPLTQGQVTFVSPHRYEELNRFRWCALWSELGKFYYACRSVERPDGKKEAIYMHRQILGLSYGDPRTGDHINRDTLNNTDENLRIATRSQQNYNQKRPKHNTSGLKGASFHPYSGMWRARIQVNGQEKTRYYHTKEEAHKAYCEAASMYFGEFARGA